MDAYVVRQLLDFVQEFIQLCQLSDWPNNETSANEIKNAFLMAQHIETCVEKLQRRDILLDFTSVLNSDDKLCNRFLKKCFSDPVKYVLSKIICSYTKITQLDLGFKIFLQIFSEEKLQNCLSDLMLEASSKETLLKNLPIEISKEKLIHFKSEIFLSELHSCEDCKSAIIDVLNHYNQDTIHMLFVSLLHKDVKYHNILNNIVNVLLQVMQNKTHSNQKFWKFLFQIEENYFKEVCLLYDDIYKTIIKALLDCGKLLCEHMSAEYFYIDLNYAELVAVVHRICSNKSLQGEFYDLIKENSCDIEFWDNIIGK